METPKLYNNTTEKVVDGLKADLQSGSRLSIAAASFSIYAYQALKEELENIAEMPSHGRAQNIAPLRRIWQRNYHEHIIRNQRAFENIMNYIDTNIEKWNQDCFYTN